MGTVQASEITFGPAGAEKGEKGAVAAAPFPSFTPPPSAAAADADDAADGDGSIFTPAPTVNPVVAAIKQAGLYREAFGNGRHSVSCPWTGEHADGAFCEASYWEPDRTNPTGRFHCAQRHAAGQGIGRLLEHLGLSDGDARCKPRIRIVPGEIHLAADAAGRVLAADGSYFSAGGPIVRVVATSLGNAKTEMINDQSLTGILAAKIDWERRSRTKGWERVDPPSNVVQMVLRGQEREHLPVLAGVARQLFYRADGSLVMTPGYDAGSGIYGVFDAAKFALEEPTRDAAEDELHYLKWLIRGCHFASDADRSAAVCAMLTAASRTSLPLAPAFNISASRSGSGKSYLAKLIARFAGPDEPYNVSYPATTEEASKVVLAMLLEKPAVVLFDDMQGNWKPYGALNKALTSATVTERVLGASKTATARTNVLVMGTGNNVEPERDMRRRVVSIYLTAPGETPALLSYTDDPVAQLGRNRERAVAAALTIISAYRAAGAPIADVPNIGTYEDWSATCRQPLLWLGETDPATSLIEQVRHDPDQDLLADFLQSWVGCFGAKAVTVRKVIEKALDTPELQDALSDLPITDGRHINSNRLGWYLKQNLGRVAGGRKIERADCSERRAWRVVAA